MHYLGKQMEFSWSENIQLIAKVGGEGEPGEQPADNHASHQKTMNRLWPASEG